MPQAHQRGPSAFQRPFQWGRLNRLRPVDALSPEIGVGLFTACPMLVAVRGPHTFSRNIGYFLTRILDVRFRMDYVRSTPKSGHN